MNDYRFIVRTLLKSYPNIPRVIKSLEKCIDLETTDLCVMSVEDSFHKIYEYKLRISRLEELQKIIKNIMFEIDRKKARLLIDKYMNNLSGAKLAKKYKMDERTVFRNLSSGISEFYYKLILTNFDKSWIDNDLYLSCEYDLLINDKRNK